MRIGIDIDNVISNFNEELLKEYINHDKYLRNTGIINQNADYIRRGMFDWTEDEEKSFYKDNIERIVKDLKVINGAKEYIDNAPVELFRGKAIEVKNLKEQLDSANISFVIVPDFPY